MARIECEVCSRQVIDADVDDAYCAPLKGGRMGFRSIICGICAKELDENGMYPEERLNEGLEI